MTDVEIEFCVPCGLLDNAQRVQRDLIEAFGQDLDGVRLAPGHGGVFQVRVDGEVVFDGQEATYEKEEVLAAVEQRL